MKNRQIKLLALAASCIALGVGIGAIATAGASTGASPSARHAGLHIGRLARVRMLARHVVEGQLVVHTPSGWATVSFERGTVESVNGSQLTLQEGTKKATYKTVTVTVPTGARVRVNHQLGTLSLLTPGMRAIVVTLPKRTLVVAHTPRTP